ncbi:prolyl aminopeptidase [Curvivirga aplysinae]|uniref:prolyl aminopeptidase n=1 Tax=Curvivirga aplysinae TaxID=2529852 RepID=UPI0012BD808B|nr:prolyl aminopeptidase [Curvivirga aplysinae]MTI10352.1 prolyl aminopeptidase [Curvivirga aplysinae]
MSRHRLYPPIEPYNHGHLRPDGHHEIYWEEVGTPTGIPVVFLHGGPGAGCNPMHRRFFNPQYYRVILMDQRGCGRSRPNGSLENNTTQDLIEDLENLRDLLGIESWIVFGGSWGSTLALAYAQAFPDRMKALVLRGVFCGRQQELDWFFHGVKHVYPEAQEKLQNFLPVDEQDDILGNYYKRLCDPDPSIHGPAARVWAVFEASCVALEPDMKAIENMINPEADLAISRLEAHYMINDLFLNNVPILENMHKIQHLPGYIVQGRYDAICPPVTAYELHNNWPKSELTMLHDAGHSASEPSIAQNLVKIMDKLAKTFSGSA